MNQRALQPILMTAVMAFSMAASTRAAADPDSDFASRCAGSGVIWCVGFDSQSEVNAIGQTRYPATAGSASIAGNPQAYPNNVAPNGLRYPAVDYGQAASGSGSLRLTANAVGDENQSGGWYLGSVSGASWPEKFGAGETMYVQWRQRFDKAYTNDVNWSAAGGEGNKQIILWRDEGSCSDLQVVLDNSTNRGYPQMYTNCGGRPLYQCPSGANTDNCHSYNTNYQPLSGHPQYLYQAGADQDGQGVDDFACMRNSESADTCGFYRDHYDVWWTYYLEIKVGAPGSSSSHIKAWMARGDGEPLRQFIDYGPFPWSYSSGDTFENLLFTLYKTQKSNGSHQVATSWYDELIISRNPIPAPADTGGIGSGGSGGGDGDCGGTGGSARPCPPTALLVE